MYICTRNYDLKRGGTFETAKAGTFVSVTAGTSIPLFTLSANMGCAEVTHSSLCVGVDHALKQGKKRRCEH